MGSFNRRQGTTRTLPKEGTPNGQSSYATSIDCMLEAVAAQPSRISIAPTWEFGRRPATNSSQGATACYTHMLATSPTNHPHHNTRGGEATCYQPKGLSCATQPSSKQTFIPHSRTQEWTINSRDAKHQVHQQTLC